MIAPYKVSIQLNFAYPLVLRDLAISIPIRRQGVYQQDGVVDRGAQSFVLDGLGPYRVETFEPGNRIVLEKNRTYYPASPKRVGNINRFEFKMFSNSASMLLAAEHGDIDCDIVVNAGGYRVNEIGAMMGVHHPVASMEHQYFVTEDIPAIAGSDMRMPLLRCPISYYY